MSHIRILLLLFVYLVLSDNAASSQNQPTKTTPFTLTWIEGKCKHCKIARQLAEIQFVSKTDAWAVGFLWPYHGQGSGDYVMVHTTDGGITWKEFAASGMHAAAPTFSFLDAQRGWVSSMASGEWTIRQTEDGGQHWKVLSDNGIQISQFFSAGQGYGVGSCKGEGACFFRTLNGGRKWEESALPNFEHVDKTFFLNPQTGWIAGKTQDGKELVLRTTDAGKNWDACTLDAGPDIAEVRDLFFLDAQRGWLITWAFNDGGTRLFHTMDGGKSWRVDSDDTFQGKKKWLSTVRFINEKTGFAFNSVDTGDHGVDSQSVFDGNDKNNVLYTSDGGLHWESFPIPRYVYNCQIVQGDLLCSAIQSESGLWLVRVHSPAAD